MHTERTGEWLNIYQLSVGSIGYCDDRMAEILSALGNEAAVQLADEAKQKCRQALKMKYAWKQQKKKKPLERKGTQEVDNRIDATLSSLIQGAEVFAGLEGETREAELAREFLDELFPEGVYPITSEPFDDQHMLVRELLDQLNGEYAEHVEVMNLESVVDQLEELNAEFGDRLEPDADGVTYDEVQSSYVAAEDAFHRLFVQVLADYSDDMETLNRVLRPVHEQVERTRRSIQNRGKKPEVDPETGEPIDESGGGSSQGDGGEPTDENEGDGSTSESDGDVSESEGDSESDGENTG